MDDEALYDAGDFGSWIKNRLDPVASQDAVVACGDCTACCTTFDGITIHHDETETLAAISTFHLKSDTRFANGSKILIANPDHTCPMLVRGKCSIYSVRPRACRAFDCRSLAAADLIDAEGQGAALGARADQWVFTYDEESKRRQLAVLDAVEFIHRHSVAFRSRGFTYEPTVTATQAIQIHELFMNGKPQAHDEEAKTLAEAVAILRHNANLSFARR
jgi:hypothetical protein